MPNSKLDYLKQQLAFQKANLFFFDIIKEDVRKIVDELMNEGIYDDAFLSVVDTTDDDADKFEQSFIKVLDIAHVFHPSDEQEAIFYLVKEIMLKIENREFPPEHGVHLIAGLFRDIVPEVKDFPDKITDDDSFENWEIDWDIYYDRFADSDVADEKKAELNEKIIAAAILWLKKYKDQHNFQISS